MSRLLVIELEQGLRLEFSLLDTPIAELWIERFNAAQAYPLDHPNRFYGFGTDEQERSRALEQILSCVRTINEYQNVITRPINSVDDQDALNYLHNIFERYHGLLDQQTSKFWHDAPDGVRRALAELNLAVHRAETAIRGARPRMVCTWFGLPKTHRLGPDLMAAHGVLAPKFGTVCLNYVEIGKTLLEMAQDDDKYIGDDAFRPFDSYSADFVIRFHEFSVDEIRDSLLLAERYFNQHRQFFENQGYTTYDDVRLLPLFFPVAQLIETQDRRSLITAIAQQQQIKKVSIQ